jgi:aldehyde dehydrogenase (NAD+)
MATQTPNRPLEALLHFPQRCNYISGQWVPERDEDSPTIPVVNPATEAVIGHVLESSNEQIFEALAAAREAQAMWARTTPAMRASHLEALAFAVQEAREELAALACAEIGMPHRDALMGQVDLPVRVLKSIAKIVLEYPFESRDQSGSTILREGAGVVLGITPWNFPVHQIIAKLGPALAAGCTVVLKPSEVTPLTGLYLAHLCDQAGIPPGVVNVLTGGGSTVGESLIQSLAYDVVSFTGSLAIGRHIGAVAGAGIKRAALELGGKSPALIMLGAPLLEAVSTTVKNCFVNAGQKCNAPTRLLVHESNFAEAVWIAKQTAEAFVLGDPHHDDTTMGPLVSEDQRLKVLGFVQRAVQAGATLVTGGSFAAIEPGFFLQPTILAGVDESSEIVQEEVFGPVLTIQTYQTEAEAIRLANSTKYGLSAEVWASDAAQAMSIARLLRAGQVRINGVRTPQLPIAPFGGYGDSGLGRELGTFGIDEFVEVKSVLGDVDVAS